MVNKLQLVMDQFVKDSIGEVTSSIEQALQRLVAIGMDANHLELHVNQNSPLVWSIFNTHMDKYVGHGAVVVEWSTR